MSNILGSIVGILLFAVFSFFGLNPFWWFAPVVIGMAHYIFSNNLIADKKRYFPVAVLLLIIPLASTLTPGMLLKAELSGEYSWSPYYLVCHIGRDIEVNNIFHQAMISQNNPPKYSNSYAFPYLLQKDAGGAPFKDVLIIGAGTGNDVSRGLQWGAQHIDAVEIDPVIINIGKKSHPDSPYQDPRVHIYQDDGRNFIRNTNRKYDLIIYALVDSIVMHSSVNNIRLESFLFTLEAFSDVRHLLKEQGIFVMYNYFRQGWLVGRLNEMLATVFGNKPIVFNFPPIDPIMPESKGGYTIIISGYTPHISKALEHYEIYEVPSDNILHRNSENGFLKRRGNNIFQLRPAKVIPPERIELTTDNWPFLYLRNPMVTNLNVRGIIIMGSIALIMIYIFMPKVKHGHRLLNFDGQMFFLGAGFMLIETKSVVQMSLLFGSTWIVNTFVFTMVLVMILGANILVIRLRPINQVLFYMLLFGDLILT